MSERGVVVLALRLLRREVLGGPHHRAGGGDVGALAAGDAEVGDPGAAVVVDQHVLRLQVAVDDPLAVGEARGVEDLAGEVDRVLGAHPALDQVLQLRAVDVLHRDEVGVAELAAVEDADHVRVLEAGGGLGLAAEALDELLVLGEAVVEDLDRDVAVELPVRGQPDVGHAAGADLVARAGSAGRRSSPCAAAAISRSIPAQLSSAVASSTSITCWAIGAATVTAEARWCARPSPRPRSAGRRRGRSR